MNALARAIRNQAGFTLAELIVAAVMGVLVLAGGLVAFQFGSRAVLANSDRAEAQQNARIALERMIQEIRGAGYDSRYIPDVLVLPGTCAWPAPGCPLNPVVNQSLTSLTLQNDLDGNGALDVPGNCDPGAVTETVRYRLVGTVLRRSTNPNNAGCESDVVAGVQQLRFTYLQDNSLSPATQPHDIRTVVVRVELTPEAALAAGSGGVVMVDRVRLRNR